MALAQVRPNGWAKLFPYECLGSAILCFYTGGNSLNLVSSIALALSIILAQVDTLSDFSNH